MHLSSTTKLPWYLSHQSLAYIHTSSLLVSLYGTNKVRVTEVLEMSGLTFVYKLVTFTMSWRSLQNSAHHQSSQPFVCCPQLHILLFPQRKPPIPVNQLNFIIESLTASVILLATYLIWLAIKLNPTNYFTIYGGTTSSFAIFAVRILQKLLCVAFQTVKSYVVLLTDFVHWQSFIFHQL